MNFHDKVGIARVTRKSSLLLVLPMVLVMFASLGVNANSEGVAVLAKVQENITVSGDRVSVQTMRLIDDTGNERVRRMKSYERGRDTMLIVFEEPADVKGVSMLSLPDKSMYLYMPAFGRVRRIASHVKNQDFMGSDFSYKDLSFNYVDNYSVISHDANGLSAHHLVLEPKTSSEISYSRVNMWVDDSYVPIKLELVGSDGKVEKRLSIKASQHKEHWVMEWVQMENTQTKHRTIVELSDVDYNPGLDRNFFSTRNLKRVGR